MNKLAFTLLVAITIGIATSAHLCHLYKCLEDKEGKCRTTTTNTTEGLTTVEVKKCDDPKKKCEISEGNGTCVDKQVIQGFAGDDCENDDGCHGDMKCENKKCKGVQKEGECNSDFYCEVGTYCDGNNCKELVATGTTCTKDEMCQIEDGCNLGKCTKYYSQPKGTVVEGSQFCESGYVHIDEQSQSICADSKLLNTNTTCNETLKCDYEIDLGNNKTTTVAKDCVCKLIESDKKFCPAGSVQTEYKDAVAAKKSNNEKNKGKHTLKRNYINSFDDSKKITTGLAYPTYDGASDCIVDALVDGMSYLKISFFGLMLFGLLF